jgi:hypothetical protein
MEQEGSIRNGKIRDETWGYDMDIKSTDLPRLKEVDYVDSENAIYSGVSSYSYLPWKYPISLSYSTTTKHFMARDIYTFNVRCLGKRWQR